MNKEPTRTINKQIPNGSVGINNNQTSDPPRSVKTNGWSTRRRIYMTY